MVVCRRTANSGSRSAGCCRALVLRSWPDDFISTQFRELPVCRIGILHRICRTRREWSQPYRDVRLGSS
jgi:hypothetical protein